MSIRIARCVSMRWLCMLRRRCRRACLVILCRPSLVFGADNLADWDEVTTYFPDVGQLNTPWRWVNAGAERLGDDCWKSGKSFYAADSSTCDGDPPGRAGQAYRSRKH